MTIGTEILNITFPEFTQDAICRTEDPEVFFSDNPVAKRYAIELCRMCPVMEQCLAYAVEFEAEHPGSRWGVYGGTTARQRRTLTTKTRKKAS